MKTMFKYKGFSLAEVLMAVGILSIGLMLIATMFPAALYLTTVASERTMAAIVADEAFAKIQLFGLAHPYPPSISDYNNMNKLAIMDHNEFSYPSVDPCSTYLRQYYWSALCKRTDPCEYQVTVFVARKTNPSLVYYYPSAVPPTVDRPRLIEIQVDTVTGNSDLTVHTAAEAKYVNPPTAVLDDATGKIYQVIDRKQVGVNQVVTLDRPWEDATSTNSLIWLIPPPASGGKNADIEVYQEIIRF
jgi:prepilin-type N-terminal cleavage/methylation domain-containing protein